MAIEMRTRWCKGCNAEFRAKLAEYCPSCRAMLRGRFDEQPPPTPDEIRARGAAIRRRKGHGAMLEPDLGF